MCSIPGDSTPNPLSSRFSHQLAPSDSSFDSEAAFHTYTLSMVIPLLSDRVRNPITCIWSIYHNYNTCHTCTVPS
jgi:hypothetical protein